MRKEIIGNCELYLGDCMDILPTIGNVDMTLTDIPYGEVSKNGESRAKYDGQLRKIDKEEADVLNFDVQKFVSIIAEKTMGSVYIFCGIEQFGSIYSFFDNNKKDFMVRQCGWKKTNPPPTNGQHQWLSSLENCVFAKRRKTIFNQSCKSSIWEYPVGNSKLHPTEKPLSLFKYLTESSSCEGYTVLDPCMGSGTTGVACVNTDRKFIGIEKEQKYFDIACQRIEEASRQKDLFFNPPAPQIEEK